MYHHRSGPHPGPPPICFNCSKEGHFVVDCPESNRRGVGGPPPGAAMPSPSNGSYSGSPALQWTNGQNMSAPSATLTNFPKAPPVVTRYAVPGMPPRYGSFPGSYGPSPTAQPYQHLSPAPPLQSYPLQGSYPPLQYGGSAPPYSNNSPSQSYTTPSPNSYGQGYQQPSQSQYPPHNGGSQYNGSPVQPYGPPTALYQSPVRQYPPRSNSYNGPSPPQWNNSTPASVSSPFNAPPQQRPNQLRQNTNSQREYSETPSQQPQQQHTPQQEYPPASDLQQQKPQPPTPGFNTNEQIEQSQDSPVHESFLPKSASESPPSSRASTPYRKYGSLSSASGTQKEPSASVKSSPASPTVHIPEPVSLAEEAALKEAAKAVPKEAEEDEEGEYTEEDLLQEQFNWEYKKIFKEPEPTEHVALSQPLSYTFTVTPVPLMDVRWVGSVSRYARKENLKEYLKPIRTQPQWDYLKEDPAFSDVTLEGTLIPLKEVREWMAQRHGIAEAAAVVADEKIAEEALDEPAASRKRAWSDEREDVDDQVQLQDIEKPSKRQKNEAIEDNSVVSNPSGTPAPGTPVLGRSGTPTFGVPDDAWAPEPGEVASAPMDPTEALLASLGVSGAPKPVREHSHPAINEDQHATPPFGTVPHSMSPQAQASGNGTPHTNPIQTMLPQGSQRSPQGRLQNHPGYGNPQYDATQQGSPPNSNPYGGPPQPNHPYSNHEMPVYNNNIGLQSQPSHGPLQQYGAPYGNAPPPQRQPSYGNDQYGPQQVPYAPQGQYGPAPNQYPPQPLYHGPPQFGPPQPQWNGPPNGQYSGPPQYPSQGQYNPPQAQYNGPPQGQYGTPQGEYGGAPQGQWGQPQVQYNPPQGQYNNGYPSNQGPPQYGHPAYPQQVDPQYANSPQQGDPSYQQSNKHGPQPPRQDSGYVSARGSYSNDSGPNGFSNGVTPQQTPQQGPQQRQHQANGSTWNTESTTDRLDDIHSANDLTSKRKKEDEVIAETEEAIDPIESPLSPTSAEILGKLTTQPSKPRKIIRVISGKNKNASGQAEDSPAKKSRRPAPVVAEAYSRRW